MNRTTRLYIIVIANVAMVAVMLFWLHKSGVDILNSSLADNSENLGFIFDFLTFLVVSFAANICLLSYPSKRQTTLEKAGLILKQRQNTNKMRHQPRSHRHKAA